MIDSQTKTSCPLCGFQFEESENSTCAACPLGAKTCNLLCCPNCGYQWTDESKIIAKLKQWFGKKEGKIEEKN
ncbi:MAG TPA: hypothetical protein ENH29_03240 [Bacteroidetes bacterium]|nr:hypothetical protein [Bacteroidota bacterium]